jgi:hypothetical protein
VGDWEIERRSFQITMPSKEENKETALAQQVGGKHYKGLVIQPAEYCQRNRLPYCESSVIRYVTRHREKNGRQDIEKAIHCLQLLLEIEYPVDVSPSLLPSISPS